MSESIYDAWHRKLGHAEYRVTITMTGHGSDEQAAEDFLEGFLSTNADCGPVVSQDTAEDSISVTLAFSAANEQNAVELAGQIWAEGGEASGVCPGEVVHVEIERIGDREDAKSAADRVYA